MLTLKIIIFVLILTALYGFIREYSNLYAKMILYKRLYELYNTYYSNLANQIFDVVRDEENQITKCTVKEPFKGYIKEGD